MIATLDRLFALKRKLEDLQSRILLDSLSKDDSRKAMAPIILDSNEAALMHRLASEYLDEAEEVLAGGQLQDY